MQNIQNQVLLPGDRFCRILDNSLYQITHVDDTLNSIILSEIMVVGYGPEFVLPMDELYKFYRFSSHAIQWNGFSPYSPDSPLPPGESNEFFGITMNNIFAKCTCGVDSIGGGKHSDWCEKHEKEEE
jgi:hypothetical protein